MYKNLAHKQLNLVASFAVFMAFCVGHIIAAEKVVTEESGSIILDTGSFWRCHFVHRDPVAGIAPDVTPREYKKGDLHWNSSLPPAD